MQIDSHEFGGFNAPGFGIFDRNEIKKTEKHTMSLSTKSVSTMGNSPYDRDSKMVFMISVGTR